MRRIIAIFLASILLVSNTGVAMSTHYCAGFAVKKQLSLYSSDLDCGMSDVAKECDPGPSREDQINAKPCCQNVHQFLQLDEDFDVKPVIAGVNTHFVIALFQAYLGFLPSPESATAEYTDDSPPLPEQDVQVLYQTFLI